MDEYGNIKAGQFKNDPLSLAMASVPVFPPRPVPGAGNPFQNAVMSSPYGFNMDGTLGHPSSIYNPPPSHHTNPPKMNSRPTEIDVRQMSHSFPKPPSMAYQNFSHLNSCNIVTTNGFFNLNTASDVSKHSFEDVMSSPPNFNSDPSINAQMIPPKTQYLEPASSVMTDISHFAQESVNSYVQNLNPVPLASQMEPKKRIKNQKPITKPPSTNIMHVNNEGTSQIENGSTVVTRPVDDNVIRNNSSNEMGTNSDMLSKLNSCANTYKCGFCELKVSSNEALLGHLNTHVNLLPYHCGVCGLAFVEGNQLMKHVQHSHAVKAPYGCGLCSASFHQNGELKSHMESHNKTDNSTDSASKSKSTLFHGHKEKDTSTMADINQKDDDTADGEDDEDDDDGLDKFDPASQTNSATNTIIIGKNTDFTLRRGPSKIVMDDIDLNQACTVIVEPSSAGGIRKKHLFKCNYCEKVCKDKGSLVSHVRTHTKGRPYECNMCYAKFKQYAHLSDHIMTKHTKERPFVCDRCAKTFNRKSHLQDHIRLRHTEDKLYHCSECPATFQKRSEFSEHKRTHGKPPPKYQCSMCPRQFRNVTDFERHIRSHTKEKRYECEICHLTFGLLANAKKHMIKHNEERPFKCDVCPKAYHFEHDFKRHKMTHLKKKPFPCPDCYKSFKKATLLKKHLKEAHLKNDEDPVKKPFKCQACKKQFKFQWDLDRHRKIHAKKKPFPCLYCYKTYGSEAMLAKHIRVHDGQDLPLYDHSKDIIESDDDNKLKKRGRKPKLKAESDDQSLDTAKNTETVNIPQKRRGRPPKRKVDNISPKRSVTKEQGRSKKKKVDSETDDRSAPSLKVTLRRKKQSKKKFQCEECDEVFNSKVLLKHHVRTHEEDESDDTEPFSYCESTNDATSQERVKTASWQNIKSMARRRATRSMNVRVEETFDETTKDAETSQDDENTRDHDISKDEDSTRDSDTGGQMTQEDEDTRDDDTTRDNLTDDESTAKDDDALIAGIVVRGIDSSLVETAKNNVPNFEHEDKHVSSFVKVNDDSGKDSKHCGDGYFSQVSEGKRMDTSPVS